MNLTQAVVENLKKLIEKVDRYDVDDAANDRTEDTKAKQILPSADRNVAAVMYPRSGALPMVAENTHTLKNESKVFQDYTPIVDTTTMKHAEMKILDHCYANHLLGTMGYVGISKPCCLGCAAVLIIAQGENPQIGFKGTHGGTYGTGWVLPDYIAQDEGRLQKFLGEAVWDTYTQLSEQGRKDFLNTLNTRIGG